MTAASEVVNLDDARRRRKARVPGGRFGIVATTEGRPRAPRPAPRRVTAPRGRDATDRARTLSAIARLVFPHAYAEESLLWPVVRRAVPFGEALTAGVEEEHQEVNALWRRLEALQHSGDLDEDHQAVVARLVELLRADVRDEEERILPRLEETLTPTQLRMIGLGWELVRRTAPSRPHPVTSRLAPGHVITAVPLTVLDRSRDLLDAVSLRSPRIARPCRGVSARLGGAAARLERIGAQPEDERAPRRTPGVARLRLVGGADTVPGPV
ncbi:hemerythrin domain-containing protein [Nocardioides daphniae]|uniref:Hemerythrin domain-containing protein n=1 Tax=Nocardioides daphniae TaxID=402297 RepID=A0A4P7U9S7_9ACTN|nr:hemerythrin domain-containing protein [Nocardioides daphniae]QCC76716.1 hemerythrin domain-containing protein [Nocardioides daphniae]